MQEYTPSAEASLAEAVAADPTIPIIEEPMTLGGVEATQVNEYDAVNSRWLTAFTFRRGEQVAHGTSVQHVYTAAEVRRLVTEAGFAEVALHGDVDGGPYRLGSPRLLLVARR